MTAIDWLLDATVAAAGPLVALVAIQSSELSRAIVLFLAFGLLSALSWTRLAAIDVALVEASIGAGLSGALFITALRWAPERVDGAPSTARGSLGRGALVVVVALGIAYLVLGLPAPTDGLTPEVNAKLPLAGVRQPVTAVLLNYRGYDTMIEVLVLVSAALTVGVVRPRTDVPAVSDPIGSFVDLFIPGFILLSGYFLWRGAYGPGGAFQGGAVLAGGAVVSMLGGRLRALRPSAWWMRALLTLGPASFLVVAIHRLLAGAALLELAPQWAGAAIFAIELASMITIALVLATFFPSVATIRKDSPPPRPGGSP